MSDAPPPEHIRVSEEEGREIDARVARGLEEAAIKLDAEPPTDEEEEIFAALWLAESVRDESQYKTPYASMYALAVRLFRAIEDKQKLNPSNLAD